MCLCLLSECGFFPPSAQEHQTPESLPLEHGLESKCLHGVFRPLVLDRSYTIWLSLLLRLRAYSLENLDSPGFAAFRRHYDDLSLVSFKLV